MSVHVFHCFPLFPHIFFFLCWMVCPPFRDLVSSCLPLSRPSLSPCLSLFMSPFVGTALVVLSTASSVLLAVPQNMCGIHLLFGACGGVIHREARTQHFFDTEAFAHTHKKSLHTDAVFCTQRFYTQVLLRIEACSQRGAFTGEAGTFLYTQYLMRRCLSFGTQESLHADACAQN